MPVIRLLNKSVAELIAAGEVVERPASIVKELIENAIDAGATRIHVEIKNGGIRYIRVTDNGCGIPFEEMPTAFLRHATSKIATAEDLDAIMTLGFRGEALASVAAMCKVELLSRCTGADMGGRYHIEGGETLAHEQAGGPEGTTIVVRDIFFNTPARMKFLKKDMTEAAAISQIVERLALINTQISFSYIKDGKRVFTTPGDGLLLSAIRTLIGAEFADSLVPVSYSQGGIAVSGFISSPQAPRATRAMQYFYVNGRTVRSKTLTGALEEAFKQRLMGGRFPGCVLNIDLGPDSLDVNVHPAKTEVRFSDEKSIYHALYSACKEAIEPRISAMPAENKLSVFALRDFDHSEHQQSLKDISTEAVRLGTASFERPDKYSSAGPAARPGAQPRPAAYAPESHRGGVGERSASPAVPPPVAAPPAAAAPPIVADRQNTPLPAATEAERAEPTVAEVVAFAVIGELFGTYVLVEQGDCFYLIDKHATHERYRYDRLLSDPASIERQTLLTPEAVHLPRMAYAAALDHIGAFEQMGFLLEDFGDGTLLVREQPMVLSGADLPAVIAEMAGAMADYRRDLTPDFIAGLFASVACRGSVMAGDHSRQEELVFLADLALNRGITHCPHGRPTSYRYTRREIERMFGRLV